jgi:hypothetical protein
VCRPVLTCRVAAWYTNPQTEAFCGMLAIPNKINPAPPADHPADNAPLHPAI